MANIIVAAPPITGEVMPLLHLARQLSDRGHRIAFLTGSRFRGPVRDAGLEHVALTGRADYDLAELIAARDTAGLPSGAARRNFNWIELFVEPMPDQYRALQRLLEEDPQRCLIANTMFLGAMPAAVGAPGRRPRRWVAVSAVPLILSSDDTTYFGPVKVGPGADQRAANRAANAAHAADLGPTQQRLNALLSTLGATARSARIGDEIVTLADATAVLSVPGFEFARSDLPGNVHLVGVVPAQEPDGWRPPAWWAELDGSRPVVVVTQGTVANQDLSQLVEPTLRSLSGRELTVVAALGQDPSALTIPVPANARVERFIPFSALLPKADVLITNGGAGGTHQALAAGVPVIMAGTSEDKPANAARVAHHRLGIDLATATPSPEAVGNAVTQVLADADIRENVRRLAKVYTEYDAVERIERLTVGR
ncbi:glycosyl transferase [Virgisporangium aliadipatigenens]|uniref:Glycosyl transferase n=1 Tax=Virgisporangium aliadipatigenens TaxID=741659 RepID=A0A8J4DTG3_9ACTN|nr:glycosyltransferase [Virgisporangium aliadipatigenens]GIJ48207.1 glycosyl transferase [Virgisporangium aliadipatigenens]